jgi:hypothetical protein
MAGKYAAAKRPIARTPSSSKRFRKAARAISGVGFSRQEAPVLPMHPEKRNGFSCLITAVELETHAQK